MNFVQSSHKAYIKSTKIAVDAYIQYTVIQKTLKYFKNTIKLKLKSQNVFDEIHVAIVTGYLNGVISFST